MSSARRTLITAVVAVLGIALAAAVTWGTSQLVRQRIGLASEPLTAGRRLLPALPRAQVVGPVAKRPRGIEKGSTRTGAQARSVAPTAPSVTPTAPSTTSTPSSPPPPPLTPTTTQSRAPSTESDSERGRSESSGAASQGDSRRSGGHRDD